MEAEVIRSRAQEARQRELLKNGSTTQVKYDQALKTLKTRKRNSMQHMPNRFRPAKIWATLS
jgi:hypothetical protein